MDQTRTFWQFLRDDVWTWFALALFGVGCVLLLLPQFYSDLSPLYRWSVWGTGGVFLILRLAKLIVLLCFGNLAMVELLHVEHRAWAVCYFRYRWKPKGILRSGKKQIFFRRGELVGLFLPILPSFHLIAWREKPIRDCPSKDDSQKTESHLANHFE